MVNFVWDEEKNARLKEERGVTFDEVAEIIVEGKDVTIVSNRRRSGQKLFLVPIRGYIHVVPFTIDRKFNIILKTIYPSRKFHQMYKARRDEG